MTVLTTCCPGHASCAARLRVALAVALCALGASSSADDSPMQELDCLVEPFLVVDVGSARGIVKSVAVDRSDTVSKNDVLVRLEDSEQAATVRQARARASMSGELKAREAALAFAQRKLDRISELYSSDAISSFQRDEVQTELELATQQLRQARESRDLARFDLERAQIELARRTIRSPVDGVVVERFVSPGEFINDTPLVRVAQMNPLRVEAIAPSSMYGSVQPGMLATINAGLKTDAALTATVTIVDRLIDPASNTFGIRLELPNPDYSIPSGLNCRLNLGAVSAARDPQPDPGEDRATATSAEPLDAAAPATVTPPAAWGMNSARHDVPKPSIDAASSRPASKRMAAKVATEANPAPRAPLSTANASPTVAGVDASPLVGTARRCVTLGPIDDESLWRKLQLALAKQPVAVTARIDEDAETTIGHFVLTARDQSMAATRQTGARLRDKGIRDLAVLTRPPYEQRVSLGLYTRLDGARQRKAELDALGLGVATEILPRTRPGTAHWIDVAAATDVLDEKPWSTLAPDIDAEACDEQRFVAHARASSR